MNKLKVIFVLSAVFVFTGCRVSLRSESLSGPNYYYLTGSKDLSSVGRVAIVELENESDYPNISGDVAESLYEQLQKRQIFGLSIVRKSDDNWRSLQVPDEGTFSLEQLAAIRKSLKCNAILVGVVTKYNPYPHMSIGLRLKMVDLTDGQLLWGLEQVWDSADKKTQYRIERYFDREKRSGFGPLREDLVAVSPIEFLKFVTYEVASTL
jgi:hypothetical protein